MLVSLKIKSPASGTSSTATVNVYVVASADDGTTQSENAGASDAAITLTVPPNARLIGIVNMAANATTYYGGPFSVASGFGGTVPKYWSLVVQNSTGGTLDATGGSHAVAMQGVTNQYT